MLMVIVKMRMVVVGGWAGGRGGWMSCGGWVDKLWWVGRWVGGWVGGAGEDDGDLTVTIQC